MRFAFTVSFRRKSNSIGMAHCSVGWGCFCILCLICSNFFMIASVVSDFVARSDRVNACGCPWLIWSSCVSPVAAIGLMRPCWLSYAISYLVMTDSVHRSLFTPRAASCMGVA